MKSYADVLIKHEKESVFTVVRFLFNLILFKNIKITKGTF